MYVNNTLQDGNDELRRSPGTPVYTAPECCLGEDVCALICFFAVVDKNPSFRFELLSINLTIQSCTTSTVMLNRSHEHAYFDADVDKYAYDPV